MDVCVFERGRGVNFQPPRTLMLCDKDWRGPGSDVTTLTPEGQLNECRRTLMNRHAEESNAGLIRPRNPLAATFFSFVSPHEERAVRCVTPHPGRPSLTHPYSGLGAASAAAARALCRSTTGKHDQTSCFRVQVTT